MATMGMERIPTNTVAMAIMVMLTVIMDMLKMGMVIMTKRRSKIGAILAFKAVWTTSPSALTFFLFRSFLKIQKEH